MADKRTDPEAVAQRIKNSVPKPANEVAPEEEQSPEVSPVSAPAETPENTEAPVEAETPVEPTRRDKFREGIKSRNADLDMEDDDAYYDYLDGQLAERDGYEGALNNLRSSIDESPEFAEMLVEATQQKNYSPLHYLLKKVADGEIDLDELKDNPDYMEEWTDAQGKALEKKENQKKIDEEGQKNFDNSIALMKQIQQERGLTDEQVNQAMEKVYKIFDDLLVNKIDADTFNAILDSMNYEKDVEDAHNLGMAEGLNKKITDRVRKLGSSTPNRAGGSQQALAESRPTEAKQPNMFGL